MSVDDVMWEMEIEERMKAEAERDDALTRLAVAERELERWKHGLQVEGDYICPRDHDIIEMLPVMHAAQELARTDMSRDEARARISERYTHDRRNDLDACEHDHSVAEAALLAAVRAFDKTQETP